MIRNIIDQLVEISYKSQCIQKIDKRKNPEITITSFPLFNRHENCRQYIYFGGDDPVEVGMVVYEFYWRDGIEDAHLLGILPERRKEPTRITDESIMNWVKKVIGDDIRVNDIFFCKVNIE